MLQHLWLETRFVASAVPARMMTKAAAVGGEAGKAERPLQGTSGAGAGMTRPFRAPGDPMPAKPPTFPHKPPAGCPPRRKPKPAP
jgi:hypothetical protein